jgi:hypothetical protein
MNDIIGTQDTVFVGHPRRGKEDHGGGFQTLQLGFSLPAPMRSGGIGHVVLWATLGGPPEFQSSRPCRDEDHPATRAPSSMHVHTVYYEMIGFGSCRDAEQQYLLTPSGIHVVRRIYEL